MLTDNLSIQLAATTRNLSFLTVAVYCGAAGDVTRACPIAILNRLHFQTVSVYLFPSKYHCSQTIYYQALRSHNLRQLDLKKGMLSTTRGNEGFSLTALPGLDVVNK